MNGEQVGCVFPLNGTVIGFGGPSTQLAAGWIEDVRNPRRTFTDALVAAVKEQGVEHGVIGVCGLEPSPINLMRAPDGVVGSLLMDRLREAFPDARIDVRNTIVGDGWAVQEFTFEGTHEDTLVGPGGEIPATHRHLSGRGVQIMKVDSGKIADVRLYFDQVDVLTQLGVMPAAAGATA